MTLPRYPTTNRLRDALQERTPPDVGVGLSSVPRKPDPADPTRSVPHVPPYLILYPMWTTLTGPPLGTGRHDDGEWTYQVSVIGQRGDQVEIIRDAVYETVLGIDPTTGLYRVNLNTAAVKIIGRREKDDSGIDEAVGDVIPTDLRFGLTFTPA